MKFAYSLHGRQRSRRTKIIELIIIFILLSAIGLVLWWVYVWLSKSNDTGTISQETVTVTSHELKTFTTPHFTFQTEMNWEEMKAESTPQKFVYRAFNSTLVEQDLTIHVNPSSEPPDVSRLQVVSVDGDRLKAVGGVSEHCRKAGTPGNKNNEMVTFLKVRMLCDNDGTNFNVLVGAENGSGVLNMRRSDGSTQRLTIIYRDLEATPLARDLKIIVSSFQSL